MTRVPFHQKTFWNCSLYLCLHSLGPYSFFKALVCEPWPHCFPVTVLFTLYKNLFVIQFGFFTALMTLDHSTVFKTIDFLSLSIYIYIYIFFFLETLSSLDLNCVSFPMSPPTLQFFPIFLCWFLFFLFLFFFFLHVFSNWKYYLSALTSQTISPAVTLLPNPILHYLLPSRHLSLVAIFTFQNSVGKTKLMLRPIKSILPHVSIHCATDCPGFKANNCLWILLQLWN